MKRWMTRARGMAYPILRRMCHIDVTLAPRGDAGDEDEKPAKAPAPKKGKAAGGKAAEKKGSKKTMAGAK